MMLRFPPGGKPTPKVETADHSRSGNDENREPDGWHRRRVDHGGWKERVPLRIKHEAPVVNGRGSPRTERRGTTRERRHSASPSLRRWGGSKSPALSRTRTGDFSECPLYKPKQEESEEPVTPIMHPNKSSWPPPPSLHATENDSLKPWGGGGSERDSKDFARHTDLEVFGDTGETQSNQPGEVNLAQFGLHGAAVAKRYATTGLMQKQFHSPSVKTVKKRQLNLLSAATRDNTNEKEWDKLLSSLKTISDLPETEETKVSMSVATTPVQTPPSSPKVVWEEAGGSIRPAKQRSVTPDTPCSKASPPNESPLREKRQLDLERELKLKALTTQHTELLKILGDSDHHPEVLDLCSSVLGTVGGLLKHENSCLPIKSES